MEKYLVINAGSSSLKFSLYEMPEEKEIVSGIVERIGESNGSYTFKHDGKKVIGQKIIKDHTEAVETMLAGLLKNQFISDISEIKGVGHRVLHGGEIYSDSVLIDSIVLDNIRKLIPLGPLHHPGEIAGIESIMKVLPSISEVAVFDTAFHQTMSMENYMYPTPYSWYKENGVRKYGFHGTSHKYITETMKKHFNKDDVNLIICHLGSGASISCIKDGKCVDTSMGLTPLDGLMMGTRSGAIDPSILEYICKSRNITIEDATKILNKQSGFLGIAGKNDFRDVCNLASNGDNNAKLALLMFKKSIIKYIAEYYFELNGNLDGLVFTAGIGENSQLLRNEIVDLISSTLSVKIDNDIHNEVSKNKNYNDGVISSSDSKFQILVVPTNEEVMIVRDTYSLINKEKEVNKVYKK